MAPIRSSAQRCSPRKGRSSPCASNLPADSDKHLEPKDLVQKMSQIVDLLEEDVKRSRKEVEKLMTEKKMAEKAQADAKGAEENLRKMMEQFTATHADAVKCGKPVTAAKLKELFENKHIYMVHYTCPISGCLIDVESRPMENKLAGTMINAVNDTLGPPAKQVDLSPHLDGPDIWVDIFYDEA
ncbi:hypothetical protein PISMIDRAFT_14498 [Pisolithus microcarpus 441]|uniref:Uncharacterized protein n=1 Tax=Pisolithus microcarpus 441 TaxID=765257 RepID=A0A0C9Z750_9AGAM|nr:hypothetical protein PISMIDRAFT_14498 [Pisolithus microcarpus 441]